MPTRKTLTDASAQKLKTAAGKEQTDYFDAQYPGLCLRVSKNGRKSWCYFFRHGGEQRRVTFGVYPAEFTVAAAHEWWRKAREEVRAGRDPTAKPKAPEAATDFGAVFEKWMLRDQADKRSAKIQRRSIERDVLPFWKARDISSIGRRDCLDILDAVADSGRPVAARRLHSRLRRLFQWALGRGIVTVNPLNGVPKTGVDVPRERALSDDELKRVWNAADTMGQFGRCLQLLVLTGCRREEIAQLRWSEISGDTITLPASRTKNGETHLVPLSAPAKAILDELPRVGDLIFSTPGGSNLNGSWSARKAQLDAIASIEPWRVHDLRRTVAVGLQRLGVQLQVVETILGHTSGSRSGIVKIYQTYHYEKETASALEAWGAHIEALIHGSERGKVVPIRA
jgi:integrase